jgi:hypothetical protein
MSIHDEGKGASPKRVSYDSIKAGGGKTANDIPPGRYEAIVAGVTLQDMNENGQSLRINFELCSEDVENGDLPTWFKFYRGDGSVNEFAIGLWKTTLAKLGYQDVKEAELPELLEQISADKPGVIVLVTYQNVKGVNYQRVNVESLCDNDVVARYKDKHNADPDWAA